MNEYIIISKTPFFTFQDYPDNKSGSIVIFFSGCDHNCKGCQNAGLLKDRNNIENEYNEMIKTTFNEKDTDIKYYKFSNNIKGYHEFIHYLLYYTKRNRTNKIVFEGGDPFWNNGNLQFIKGFLEYTKDINLEYNNELLEICIYTGYDIETVKKFDIYFEKYVKYLKCGTFDVDHYRQSQKDNDKLVLASPNQDFYNPISFEKLSKDGIFLF